MRSPSSRVLKNRININVAINGVDVDGGPVWTYPTTPTFANVPCSVQATNFESVIDNQDRLTQVYSYKVFFGTFYLVTPRDKLVYTDTSGNVHTLFYDAERDEASRGSTFSIRAVERI